MRHPETESRTGSARPAPAQRKLVHGFKPGKAVAGLAVLTTALLYAGDASDAWQTPWFVALPVVFGGLFLAGTVSLAHYSVRRRRSAMRASTESTDAPPITSGSQAIR
ncbi:hypothetical protein ACWEFL_12605 [Streptomyces sp. NPDC004838]